MAAKRSHWITVAMVTEAMGLGDKCLVWPEGDWNQAGDTQCLRCLRGTSTPGTRMRSTQDFGQCLQLRLGGRPRAKVKPTSLASPYTWFPALSEGTPPVPRWRFWTSPTLPQAVLGFSGDGISHSDN